MHLTGPQQQRGSRVGIVIAVAVSVVLHGVLFGMVLVQWAASLKGGDGQQLDAIEIEVVDADALESPSKTREQGGGNRSTSAETIGSGQTDVAVASAASTPSQPPTPQNASTPEADAAVGEQTAGKPLDTAPVKNDAAVVLPVTPDAAPAATANPAASTPAGSTATAAAINSSVPAAAGASPGQIDRYRLDVRRALSRHPPRPSLPAGSAASGTALIAFSISDTGAVEDAALLQATRSARLNQLLLAWIKTTAMPTPPPGLSRDERRFSIPFTVR